MRTPTAGLTLLTRLSIVALAAVAAVSGQCNGSDLETEAVSLVRNASFENGTGDMPFSWLVSIAPAEGASAAWDDKISYNGLRSVQLSTAEPYPTEPYNNWSQNIDVPLGGKRVTVSGYVKGRLVNDAALWLQCFQRGSATPIATVASNEMHPLQGDFGWTERQVSLYVPQGTDLVVVRLTLIGTGTVWFDDIVMEVEEPPVQKPQSAGVHSERESGSGARTAELADALETVAQENRKLRAANEQLSKQIDLLAERVKSLQTFLEESQTVKPPSTEKSVPFIVPPRNVPSRTNRFGAAVP